jgi:tRNA-Thr(GGU) m(6)t(6)A37 methyltransferase TsaA
VNGALGENELRPIGRVESPLSDPTAAPKQGDEGAPEAVLVFEEQVYEALGGLAAGDEVLLLTWLDRADRSVLTIHPRGDVDRPKQGVFNTRSPDRPNPIGLHRVEILAIDGPRIQVGGLEAIDGTPILDLKPVLAATPEER